MTFYKKRIEFTTCLSEVLFSEYSMQELRDLAQQVDTIYTDVSQIFFDYQQKKSLFCRSGCGKCCLHPTIYASVLEMLPLALHLYDTGLAEWVLETLEPYDEKPCFFYKATSEDLKQGYCSIYNYRGSVCRMFGAAAYPNKYGKAELSTCQPIKEDNPEHYRIAILTLESEPAPMMKHWKDKINAIDYRLGHEELPMKEAIIVALNKVLMCASFSDPNYFDSKNSLMSA
jgi:Fe-S-cluster containining protein